jgi:hypothetical protein
MYVSSSSSAVRHCCCVLALTLCVSSVVGQAYHFSQGWLPGRKRAAAAADSAIAGGTFTSEVSTGTEDAAAIDRLLGVAGGYRQDIGIDDQQDLQQQQPAVGRLPTSRAVRAHLLRILKSVGDDLSDEDQQQQTMRLRTVRAK